MDTGQAPSTSAAQTTPSELCARFARIAELEQKGDDEALTKIALAIPAQPSAAENRVRVSAIHAIANVGGERAMKTLRHVLADRDSELILRLAAAHALGRKGGDADVAFLRSRLEAEPSKILREKIRVVLEDRG